jgi:Flp pilus assembly pilin Flp
MSFIRSLDQGQGLVEYALLIALIVLIVIVLLYVLGPGVGNMYSQIVDAIGG